MPTNHPTTPTAQTRPSWGMTSDTKQSPQAAWLQNGSDSSNPAVRLVSENDVPNKCRKNGQVGQLDNTSIFRQNLGPKTPQGFSRLHDVRYIFLFKKNNQISRG